MEGCRHLGVKAVWRELRTTAPHAPNTPVFGRRSRHHL